ncbi:MAG: acylphosphatase, partial [Inquilinaceae bacterium]
MIRPEPTSEPRDSLVALGLVVEGTVQGVGFRPFVHGLATAERLSGWVRNSADGVHIAVFGEPADIDRFRRRLSAETPPLARIVRIGEEPIVDRAPKGFAIIASTSG